MIRNIVTDPAGEPNEEALAYFVLIVIIMAGVILWFL